MLNSMTWGKPEIVSKKEVGSGRCFLELAPQEGNQCAEDGRRSMNTRSLSSSDWGLTGVTLQPPQVLAQTILRQQVSASVREQVSQVHTHRTKSWKDCVGQVPQKRFVQQGKQIKSTHQGPGIPGCSPSSTAGISIHCPCWDLQSPHSWRGGSLFAPTVSYDAIHCSLSRILTFSKIHWAEHSYTSRAFLWPHPGK